MPETFIQRQEESFLDWQRGAIPRATLSVTPLTLLSQTWLSRPRPIVFCVIETAVVWWTSEVDLLHVLKDGGGWALQERYGIVM